MQKNSDEIKDVLRGLSYNQHQERMIIILLKEYPKLLENLKQCKEDGAKKVDIDWDHCLTEPKLILIENIATIYINK